MKRALVLGIGGQDGSFLADILLEKGYEVHGLVRRSSVDNLARVRHVLDRITLHQGDICDGVRIGQLLDDITPDEVYNEADQDSVGHSFASPCAQMDVTAKAVVGILEALRYMGGNVRFFQPVSATMFGGSPPPQNELTSLDPQSPYAVAKAAAYHACRHYRRAYGMHVSTAIFFNHDSPRRGEDYLLHKIRRGVLRVTRGEAETLAFGNLDLRVDIGYAREYMKAAWQIVQLDKPGDFVLATGRPRRIGELVTLALRCAGIDPHGRIVPDVSFRRPTPEPELIGDAGKAYKALGWRAEHDAADVLRTLMAEGLAEELKKCASGPSVLPRAAAWGT